MPGAAFRYRANPERGKVAVRTHRVRLGYRQSLIACEAGCPGIASRRDVGHTCFLKGELLKVDSRGDRAVRPGVQWAPSRERRHRRESSTARQKRRPIACQRR